MLDFGWWKPVLLWDKKPITVQFRCLESYSPRAGQGWPSRAPSLLSWEVRAGSPGKSWCSHVRIQRSKGFVERKLQRWRESLLTIQLNVPWRMHLRKAVLGKNHPKGLDGAVGIYTGAGRVPVLSTQTGRRHSAQSIVPAWYVEGPYLTSRTASPNSWALL